MNVLIGCMLFLIIGTNITNIIAFKALANEIIKLKNEKENHND